MRVDTTFRPKQISLLHEAFYHLLELKVGIHIPCLYTISAGRLSCVLVMWRIEITLRSSCRKFTNVNLIKIIIIFMSDTIIIIIIVIIIIIIIMISSTFINANSIKSAEVKVVDSPQWLMNRTASAKYSPVESLFWCTVSPLAFIDSKIWCNFFWFFCNF